jgi:CRISPR-associated protein Cas1
LKPLLLSGFGISLFVEKAKLVVENRLKRERFEFYPHQIEYDSIILDSRSGNVTFEAIRWLMKHDIPLTMLNWNGELLSMTLPREPKSGLLRVAQYSKFNDSKIRYQIASEIVRRKIAGTRNLLLELSRYYEEIDSKLVQQRCAGEERNFSKSISSIPNLMNYEGRLATFYWDTLSKVFNKLYPQFHFKNRMNKSYSWNMNASDEINALLNYGYSILESEVRKAINAIGLDPAIGFLHALSPSKEPLVYDIQELFRWLIDLSVIQLLESKKLKKSDFVTTENYHIRLTEKAAKLLLERISFNFNRKASYKHGKQFTYQSILQDCVQQLANYLIAKKAELKLNIPLVRIKRTDPIDLRTKILALTPHERKALQINKSTLWYQQRNLREGKRIRVYRKVMTKLTQMPS